MPANERSVAPSPAPELRWRPPAAAAGAERDRGWDLLLVLVAAYILVAVGRVHQLFPFLAVVRPALLVGALAVAVYLTTQAGPRRVGLVWVTPVKCLTGLLCWMALAVPTALVIGNSLSFVLQNFAKTALMVFVTAGCVRTTRDVERLAGVYFAGAVFYSLIALGQFQLGSGWRLGSLFYYDANDLATFLVTALPLGIYFLHAARRSRTRLLAGGGVLLVAVAFVSTGSRGGFLAMAVVVAWIVVRYTAIPLRVRIGATVLVTATVIAFATDQYWNQMGTILEEEDYNWTEQSGRIQIWSRGLGYMMARPVFGVGPGNFATAEGTLSPLARRQQYGFGVRWNAAHNAYLQAGAENGLPGLALFLGMIVATFRGLQRYRRRARAHRIAFARPDLSQALTISLVGFCVGAFFLSLAYHEMLYTLIALSVGLMKTLPRLNPVGLAPAPAAGGAR